MPAIFFKSECLSRVIYLSNVENLTYKELVALRAELKIDIKSMETRMYEQRDEALSEWLCSISYKLSVCRQFSELCEKFLDHRDKQNFVNLVFDCVAEQYGRDAAKSCWSMAREKLKAANKAFT